MKRALFPLVLVSMLWLPGLRAQDQWCLTPPVKSPWLQAYQANPEDYPDLRTQTGWQLPVVIHITENGNGIPAVEVGDMLNAFCKLNEDFEPSGIQFYIKSIEFLDRPDYYDHYQIGQAVSMITNHSQPNAINVFFVRTAVEDGICGYNLVDQKQQSLGITLAGSCTNRYNSNWAHEMGHFFSLPHTFHGWEGIVHDYRTPAPTLVNNVPVEHVNGSNCQLAGDGFCDTPADYLNGRWFCAEDGASSFLQMDPEGISFRSDGSMIMSYAQDGCAHRFSPRQLGAMQNYLVSQRSDLMGEPISLSAIRPNEINLIFPSVAQRLPYSEQIRFEWDRVNGAMGYILEISLLPTFAVLEQQAFVFTADFNVAGLRPGRTYYWRVRPFNNLHTCPVYSMPQSFTLLGLTTETTEPVNLVQLQLQPNPLSAGRAPVIRMATLSRDNWEFSLFAVDGQNLANHHVELPAGEHEFSLDLGVQLSPGMYLLHIQNDQGRTTRRLVVW